MWRTDLDDMYGAVYKMGNLRIFGHNVPADTLVVLFVISLEPVFRKLDADSPLEPVRPIRGGPCSLKLCLLLNPH